MTTHAPRHARSGDARHRAAEALARVESEGAFAAAVLDASLDRSPTLDARDRALATEIVYGVLRSAPALDAALGRHARDGVKSIAKLDPWTRSVLRVAAYQILALGRVPPRAAVDAAVEGVKRSRTPRLAGFVNAVLRKLAGERPEPLPDDARVELAMRSIPGEVRAKLAGVVGDAEVDAVLRAMLGAPPRVTLRVQPARISRDALLERLREELPEAEVTPGKVSPLALRVVGGGDPTRTKAWREGLFGVQEEGAQAVVALAEIKPGMRVLDACAGRGGKSLAAATWMEGRGVLHAVDLFPEKLARLTEELARLGLARELAVETFAADLTRGVGALARKAPPEGYDVVMVDAPCSGLGTLGHRPDLLLRLRDAAAWKALTELQRAILANVAPQVRNGGTLLYVVCTLTREEGDAVVEEFLREKTKFRFVPYETESRVVLRPDRDETDGFMVFRLRRVVP